MYYISFSDLENMCTGSLLVAMTTVAGVKNGEQSFIVRVCFWDTCEDSDSDKDIV